MSKLDETRQKALKTVVQIAADNLTSTLYRHESNSNEYWHISNSPFLQAVKIALRGAQEQLNVRRLRTVELAVAAYVKAKNAESVKNAPAPKGKKPKLAVVPSITASA